MPLSKLRHTVMILAAHIGSLYGQQDQPPGPDGFGVGYLPVHMRIDNDRVKTSILLELLHRPAEGNLQALAQGESGPTGEAFAKLLAAFTDKQKEIAASYHKPEVFSDNSSESLANLFVEQFAPAWPSLELVRQYNLGSEIQYVWQIQGPQGSFRRITRISSLVEDLNAGRVWLEEMGERSMTVLQNVVAESEQMISQQEDELLKAGAGTKREHRTEVPNTSAWWLFDGLTASFDPFEKIPADLPDHPVARFFHESQQAFLSADPAAYAKLFTPVSQKRLLDWAASQPEGGYQQYVGDMKEQGRHVVFILDAAPVHLVFYETADGRYPYQVVYSPTSGTYQLANFFIEGIFDGMLKETDFFVNPVLKPLFGKGPEKPTEPPFAPTGNAGPQVPGAIPRAPGGNSNSGDENASPSSTQTLPEKPGNSSGNSADSTTEVPKKSPGIHPILLGILALLGVIALLALLKKFK